MASHTKRLVAYLYANVMSCGPKWATDDEIEEARLHATRNAAAQADAAETRERGDTIYRAWCKENSDAMVAEARSRGWKGSAWTKIAKEWWPFAEKNPATHQQNEGAQNDRMETDEPPAGEDGATPMETDAGRPFFAPGSRVWYTDGLGNRTMATIVATHLDDVVPYYTIKVGEGNERETTHERLEPLICG
eukprot:5428974-Prymnesium_polylepis.1